MAERQLFPPPDSQQLSKEKSTQNWKRFKPKWNNYELAAGVACKDDDIRVTTLLTVIGDEALDVYNAFMWDSDHDKVKIAKGLEQFEKFCETRKNTIYKDTLSFHEARKAVNLSTNTLQF